MSWFQTSEDLCLKEDHKLFLLLSIKLKELFMLALVDACKCLKEFSQWGGHFDGISPVFFSGSDFIFTLRALGREQKKEDDCKLTLF